MEVDDRLRRMEDHMLAHRVVLGVLLNRISANQQFAGLLRDMEEDVRNMFDSKAFWEGTTEEDRQLNHRILHEIERLLRPQKRASRGRSDQ